MRKSHNVHRDAKKKPLMTQKVLPLTEN